MVKLYVRSAEELALLHGTNETVGWFSRFNTSRFLKARLERQSYNSEMQFSKMKLEWLKV